MPLGLTVALALAAQAAPAAPAAAEAATSVETCQRPPPSPDTIVVCAERPEGFRIDPDILTARKMKRSGGRPVRPGPGGAPRDRSPCVVGPHGCPSAGINLIGAAVTAAEMASRLLKGQEIGSMFVTDPQPSEYQLYAAAKRAREAAAAEKAAKAKLQGAK